MQLLAANKLKVGIVLASALLLSACSNPIKEKHSAMLGSWTISDVEGRSISNDAAKMIFLSDGKVAGSNGCNTFKGTFRPVEDHLNLKKFSRTKLACDSLATADAKAFNSALSKIEHFLIKDEQLLLTNKQDETVISLQR